MRSNKVKYLFPLLIAALLAAGCMNKYYDQFGGYPMDTKTITLGEDKAEIKLLVSHRFPYQAENWDTTKVNMNIKVVINKKDEKRLYFRRLAVAALDETYLYSYANPAVYDAYGKYPIRLEYTDAETGSRLMSSDQPSIFTISRASPEYEISLFYKIKSNDGAWQDSVQTAPLDVSELKIRMGLDNPEFLQGR